MKLKGFYQRTLPHKLYNKIRDPGKMANGSKTKMRQERNAKNDKKGPNSQLKAVNRYLIHSE